MYLYGFTGSQAYTLNTFYVSIQQGQFGIAKVSGNNAPGVAALWALVQTGLSNEVGWALPNSGSAKGVKRQAPRSTVPTSSLSVSRTSLS